MLLPSCINALKWPSFNFYYLKIPKTEATKEYMSDLSFL